MFDGIGALDWLVILCALALGFGLVKFMIVVGGQKRSDPSTIRPGAAGDDPRRTSESAETSHPPSFAGTSSEQPRPWFDVLGVLPDASWGVIRAAYQVKLSEYHPAKVESLGPEFKRLAERMTKEINAAYEQGRVLREPRGS